MFAFTYKIIAKATLEIWVNGVLYRNNVESYISTDYSNSGGFVIFTIPPKLGDVIVIRRRTSLEQQGDYQNPFIQNSHEFLFDKLTMIAQEICGVGDGDFPVRSIHGRTGHVLAQCSDYASCYAPLPHVGARTVSEHPIVTTTQDGFMSAADFIKLRDTLAPGDLLSAVPLVYPIGIGLSDAAEAGRSLTNTKQISFTIAFCRENAPNATFFAWIVDINDSLDNISNFSVAMNSDGHIEIHGRNASQTEILNVLITNNLGSFATSTVHMLAMKIDLADPLERQVVYNGVDVTSDSNYLTWTTYTNDDLKLADVAGDPSNTMIYNVYKHQQFGNTWYTNVADYNSGADVAGVDTLGFFSFDDTASLVPTAVWDSQFYVKDCQQYQGWYKGRPWLFYGPGQWRNTGRTRPTYPGEDVFEKTFDDMGDYLDGQSDQISAAVLNFGVGGISETV
jgi:hypothetical protein